MLAKVHSRDVAHSIQNGCDAVIGSNQYGISISFTSDTAKSASFPGSMLPFRSARRSAQSVDRAAATVSAGDIFMCVQASDIAMGMLTVGDIPEL